MSILITGGAGFIGSHTVDLMIEQGLDVVVVDRKLPQFLNSRAKYYYLDINLDSFEAVFQENKIDKILHLAAQPSVSFSVSNPASDAIDNILASIRVINMAKKYNVQKIVVSSSAALYANPQYFPIDEAHPTQFISPYAISKHTMEEYIKWAGIDYIILRYANVYGPRQNSQGEAGVVAIFVDNMLHDKDINIHGTGEQTRDFVYVKDVAFANYRAIISNCCNETVNISSETETTVNEVANIIKKVVSAYRGIINHTAPREGDIYKSVLSNQKAQKLLKFQVRTSFNQGIIETIDSFRGRMD